MELQNQKSRVSTANASSNSGNAQASNPRAMDVSAGPAFPVENRAQAIASFDEDSGDENSGNLNIHTDAQIGTTSKGQGAQNELGVIAMLMKNAQILAKAGESRLALNLLRNILMRSPEHPEALRKMGECLRSSGRMEESLKCFRALVKVTKSVESQILVAETLYLLERDQMALASYREVLKGVVPDRAALFEIYKNLGNIHVRAGDFEAAEEFYNKAYTIQPESDVLMVNYGTLEMQRENVAEAIDRFRRSVEINPQNDRGWVGLAMVHRMMGDHELSAANIERALDINPANRTAIRIAVDWGIQDQNYAFAIRRLENYVASEGSEDAEFCFILAKCLTQVGRLRDARVEMERVLALDPGIDGADALARVLDLEIGRLNRSAPKSSSARRASGAEKKS